MNFHIFTIKNILRSKINRALELILSMNFMFRCEGHPADSSAPLATNDSDDDISDDETSGVRCEEVFSR